MAEERRGPPAPFTFFPLKRNEVVLNPGLPPELKEKLTAHFKERHIKIVELKSLPPKLRGDVCDALFRERYPTIRWSFEWEGFVVTGVPDGITDKLVYVPRPFC